MLKCNWLKITIASSIEILLNSPVYAASNRAMAWWWRAVVML